MTMTTSLEMDPIVQTPTAALAEPGPTIGRRMKITCTRDELLAKLQIVGRGVSTRSSVQILSGIMVRADSAEQPVELCSTDMEISLRAPLIADVTEPGQTVLPGRLVLDIARRLPAQPITVDQSNGVARLECGASEYRLHTYLAEDFPRLPEVDRERLFAVDRTVFLETAEQVMRAASKDESRPVLTGILVELGGGTVTMAATDSYRMAVKTSQLQSGPPEELRPIVPARALAELVRIAPLVGGEELEVAVEQNQVLFGMNGVWLSARRIDGQFPSYKQLLPDAFEHDVRAEPRRARRGALPHGAAWPTATRRCGCASRPARSRCRRRPRRSARAARRFPATSAASRSRSGSTPASCATASRASTRSRCTSS